MNENVSKIHMNKKVPKKKKKKKNSIFDIPIEQSPHGCPIIPQIFCR